MLTSRRQGNDHHAGVPSNTNSATFSMSGVPDLRPRVSLQRRAAKERMNTTSRAERTNDQFTRPASGRPAPHDPSFMAAIISSVSDSRKRAAMSQFAPSSSYESHDYDFPGGRSNNEFTRLLQFLEHVANANFYSLRFRQQRGICGIRDKQIRVHFSKGRTWSDYAKSRSCLRFSQPAL